MALETKLTNVNAAGQGYGPAVVGVALFSEEPARLARFYEKVLRASFTDRHHEDGRRHWITTIDGVQLEIKALRSELGEPTLDNGGTDAAGISRSEISFRVPDVTQAVAHALVAGGASLQRAETYDWGTFAVVLDLDGNRLGLFSPPQATDTDTTNSTMEGQA